MFRRAHCAWICGLLIGASWSSPGIAQDPAPPDEATQARFELLSKTLSGAKLSGSFTVVGKEAGDLTREEYHILECKKMDEGNLWMIKARIKYGEHDVTVPIPLPIEWAGSTPVISLDNFEVPLMGTFDAQVLFDLDKKQYAGTWSHGEVGGHLFGVIIPNKAEASATSPAPADSKK